MNTVAAALAEGAASLEAAGVPGAGRDARLLMAQALGVAPGRLILRLRAPIAPAALEAFKRMIAERGRFRPVAQILGRRAFWGRDFEVTADVLDPRPETETLVARALDGPAPGRILDLGTGSGVLLVTLLAEWPRASGLGTDISAAALQVAARNAARHGVADRAGLQQADWIAGLTGRFDLVVSNPPYIAQGELPGLARDVREWEPHAALTPGPTGLESYRAIASGVAALLAPGARALFEVGAGRGAAVAGVFRAAGLAHAVLHDDMGGCGRVVAIDAAA